jgi:hypothetical protein
VAHGVLSSVRIDLRGAPMSVSNRKWIVRLNFDDGVTRYYQRLDSKHVGRGIPASGANESGIVTGTELRT